jgi:hypothetical protein
VGDMGIVLAGAALMGSINGKPVTYCANAALLQLYAHYIHPLTFGKLFFDELSSSNARYLGFVLSGIVGVGASYACMRYVTQYCVKQCSDESPRTAADNPALTKINRLISKLATENRQSPFSLRDAYDAAFSQCLKLAICGAREYFELRGLATLCRLASEWDALQSRTH